MKPICADGNINRSSHGFDPGSICVSRFFSSKARRPNASGESLSLPHQVNISPLDPICPHHEMPASCGNSPYTPESDNLYPEVFIMCVTVHRRNKAQQHCSNAHQLLRCKQQSSESNMCQQVQWKTYGPVSSQQPNGHQTAGPLLYRPPPSHIHSD